MKLEKSLELYSESSSLFPGGVSSPVRAFKSVEGSPLFIKKGDGYKIWDEDGNEFIDFCCSWGPLIHGHNAPFVTESVSKAIQNGMSFGAPSRLENELGKLIIQNIDHIDKIRFVSSGTEAVMSALRLARGHTKRDKVIKFEGCYHGHVDSMLVNAGSGLATFGISSSGGVPKSFAESTIVLPLNDKKAVMTAFEKHPNEISSIIIEPVPANNGLIIQQKEFLLFLKEISEKNGSLLIFDEVISGFRLGFGGAANHYGINPDIVTYGKIIGGGLPVGAYGSSNKIMSEISPDGNVYQAGTLSGNPIAMTAGIAQLKKCLTQGFYDVLQNKTIDFSNTINNHITKHNYNANVVFIGSIFWLSFSKDKIKCASDIDSKGMSIFGKLHQILLKKGIYFGPSGYEVGFISAAHDNAALSKAANEICSALDEVFSS